MKIKGKIIQNFGSSDIIIERGALSKAGLMIGKRISPGQVFVLTDSKVYTLYYEKLRSSISKAGFRVVPIKIPQGERFKNLTTLKKVFELLVRKKADRESLLIGLGGGVIGDLAGTVAATYMRGITLVHVPTTLLAQADASIGGKTALDLPQAKNLMGCFYPARLVIIDPLVLNSLSKIDFLNGLVEIIKMGLVANPKILKFIQDNYPKILKRDISYLQKLIAMAVTEKVRITNADPYDRGVRKILNFGHTFGHALESYNKYKKITHGEAVSLGILVGLNLSENLKLSNGDFHQEVKNLFTELGLPTQVKILNLREIWGTMSLDKKVKNRKVNFVLLKDIGKPILRPVNEKSFYRATQGILTT